MTESFDDEMIMEFVQESRDHLESIEPDLLQMEQEGAKVSTEVINRIFRAIHSIKGASGFLGFEALGSLSHVMENLLMKIRDKQMVPDPDNIDALLQGIDKAREMIGDIHNSNFLPYELELNRLNAILDGSTRATPAPDIETIPEENPIQEDDMINEFVKDSLVQLQLIQQSFSSIKHVEAQSPEQTEHIGLIAKKTNEIRTGAKFFSLDPVFQVSDALSEISNALADDKLILDTNTIHAFENAINKLDQMLNNIYKCKGISFHEEIKALKMLLHDAPSNTKPEETVKPHAPTEPVKPQTDEPTISQETIRINVDLIDRMMNLAGELVLGRNQLRREVDDGTFKSTNLASIIQNIDVVTSEMQEKIMQMRMQPVGKLLNKFKRIVRDLSRQLSKEVELILEGNEVELDKTILEGLSDPLTHLIRNSLDHGIQTPEIRKEKGKNPKGKIHIKTFHEGGQVNIMVQDDGQGINTTKLVEKAIAKNIITPDQANTLSETEKIHLIVLPGMSTADKISDISGRGVGMDVVKTNIEALGGNIEFDTTPDKGTTILIRLPLTLAIMPSLIVGAGGRRFAIPQVNVQELILIRSKDIIHKIEKLGEAEVLRLREKILPLISLTDVLGIEKTYLKPITEDKLPDRRKRVADRRATPEEQVLPELVEQPIVLEPDNIYDRRTQDNRRTSWRSDINVVVSKLGTQIFGLMVDELFDNEEIVVKPLSTHIKDCKCFAGATIMGDGKVAMILDIMGIAEASKLKFTEINSEAERRRKESEKHRNSASEEAESVLVFNNAFEEYFALPLKRISRLELIDADAVYTSGNRSYLNYRNEGLPLIHLEELIPIRPFPEHLDTFYLIIPKTGGHAFGIVVSQILDTVDIAATLKKDTITPRGLLGSIFVDGAFTMFLDTDELITMVQEKYSAA